MGIADDFHPRPVFLLNVTDRCNMSCKHCYKNSGEYATREPSYEQLIEIIDRISGKGGTVIFNGGEPFAREDLLELIDYTYSKGLHISARCNGTLFSEEKLEKIQGKINEIMVSLEGASERTHDYIRGSGSFQEAIKAFALLQKYKIPSIAGITLNKINLEEIYRFPEILLDYEFDRLAFGQLVSRGRAKTLKNLCLGLDELRYVNEVLSELKVMYSPRKIARICTIGGFCKTDELYTITLDGKVGPCFVREDLAQGNIAKDDLESLLRSVNYLRERIKTHTSVLDVNKKLRHQSGLVRKLLLKSN